MWTSQLFGLLLSMALIMLASSQDKYTNENRPYEFGFKIPGEQHRQESKDEGGIIMGEFGYITGDGIYHVTVFATDENGNYKVLSMKHIRVGPSPWGKKSKAAAPPAPTTATTTTTTPEPESEFVLQGKPGCSGCLIPTEPPPGAPPAKPLKVPTFKLPGTPNLSNRFPDQGPNTKPSPPVGSTSPFYPGGTGTRPSNPGAGNQNPSVPNRGSANPAFPNLGSTNPAFPNLGSANPAFPNPGTGNPGSNFPGSNPNIPSRFSKPEPAFGTGNPSPLNPNAGRPINGLPQGLNAEDLMGLLYKFNYTVGFHGHHETGYKNGNKEGEYYTNFRDGTERKVSYTADGEGFKPKVSIMKISKVEDVPRAETEKEYGLKGYEFKWFNRR